MSKIDRVWGKWACSKGESDPNSCPIIVEGNRPACIYVPPEPNLTVDSDLTDERIDRCQFLVKVDKSPQKEVKPC